MTTRTTVFGPMLDELGAHTRTELTGQLFPAVRTHAWATPPDRLNPVQGFIPVTVNGYTAGQVVHLERAKTGKLVAVAHLDQCRDELWPLLDRAGDTYWQPTITSAGTGIEQLEIVPRSTAIGLRPLVWRQEGWVDFRGASKHWRHLHTSEEELLERAANTFFERRSGGPLVIVDPTPANQDWQLTGQVEFRHAQQLGVDLDNRELLVRVMPYNQPTRVHHRGRMIDEIVDRSAFRDIDKQSNVVKVLLHHDRAKPVGRAAAFDPAQPDGLHALLRIAKTREGNDTLELAADGVLDVSAGFGVLEGGEKWETTTRRRLTRLFLDHVAMVAQAAYSSATVLAVGGGSAEA